MEKTFKSMEDLPSFLNADDIAAYIGISRTNAYYLFHRKGFPKLKLGKRLVVQKEKFLKWIDENSME